MNRLWYVLFVIAITCTLVGCSKDTAEEASATDRGDPAGTHRLRAHGECVVVVVPGPAEVDLGNGERDEFRRVFAGWETPRHGY